MSGYSTNKNFLINSNCVEMLDKTKLPNLLYRPNTFQSYYNSEFKQQNDIPTSPNLSDEKIEDNSTKLCNELQHTVVKNVNSSDPEVWGPSFWFSLHNGALKYPINPSPIWKERMKHFIIGIPVMLPCEKCSHHASSYIESQYKNLDDIVKNKDNLFTFFCNFHNIVNERLNKPQITIEEAYKLYNNNFNVTKIN